MCGRFALISNPEKIKAQFHVEELPFIDPNYNTCPTEPILCLVVSPDFGLKGELFRWGLIPYFSKDTHIPLMINAKSETIATKNSFRKSFMNKRCLVIMDGFFEWKLINGVKQPFYIYKKNEELLAIAAIWDVWQSPEGQVIYSCCLVTTNANSFLQSFHDRMPVILTNEKLKIWVDNSLCDTDTLLGCLNPYSIDDLDIYPVSQKMGSRKFKHSSAISPIELSF